MRAWQALAAAGLYCGMALAGEPVTVTVDLSKPEGRFQPITNWFGYDESGYTLAPNGQALLRELAAAYSEPVYVRAHHLFTSGDGTADLKWSSTNIFTRDAAGKPVYNFAVIDKIFDAWRAAGVTPMVELGFMPEALSRKPEPYRIHFEDRDMLKSGAQEPPTSYTEWGELVRVFTAHLVARYGEAEVGRWYFEVWNEPDIPYWHGTREEYFKLYDYAAAGVRAALPHAKIGGPATTSPRGENGAGYLKAFLDHCAKEKSAASGKAVPLDFISFHAKGQPKLVDGHVRMGLDKELLDVRNGLAIVTASPFAKLPVILSEADPEGCAACSAKQNPANAYRNGPLYAAYTAAAHKGMLDLARDGHANLISLLSWSFEFENRGYFEGFRTLATNGIDKPVLNFFRMAGMMSGNRVAAASSGAKSASAILASGAGGEGDVDVLASADKHRAAIMLWNYHDDDVAAEPADVKLAVQGLAAGRVKLSEFRIDGTHSNAYALWQAMGSPQNPSADQIAKLKAAGGLALAGSPRFVSGKSLKLDLSLPRQGLALLLLEW